VLLDSPAGMPRISTERSPNAPRNSSPNSSSRLESVTTASCWCGRAGAFCWRSPAPICTRYPLPAPTATVALSDTRFIPLPPLVELFHDLLEHVRADAGIGRNPEACNVVVRLGPFLHQLTDPLLGITHLKYRSPVTPRPP